MVVHCQVISRFGMEKGDLDVAVFQDAKGQGAGSVETASRLMRRRRLSPLFWIRSSLSLRRTQILDE